MSTEGMGDPNEDELWLPGGDTLGTDDDEESPGVEDAEELLSADIDDAPEAVGLDAETGSEEPVDLALLDMPQDAEADTDGDSTADLAADSALDVGDVDVDVEEGASEYGWTADNDEPDANWDDGWFEESDRTPSSEDDGGAEGVEDLGQWDDDDDVSDLPPLRGATDDDGADDADAGDDAGEQWLSPEEGDDAPGEGDDAPGVA